jgi:hypothetical protein
MTTVIRRTVVVTLTVSSLRLNITGQPPLLLLVWRAQATWLFYTGCVLQGLTGSYGVLIMAAYA